MSESGKVLCTIKNPSSCKNRGWFYNIFLGNLSKIDKKHEQQKTNWLMKLNEEEIRILKERECEIIVLNFNNTVKKIDKHKDGFVALLGLFESLMSDKDTINKKEKELRKLIKLEIRKLLTNEEGRPSEQYKTIMRTKEYLEEDKNDQ